MSVLRNAASAVNIAKGALVLRMGHALVKKENKTPFEEKAAKAFQRTTIGTLILVGLMVVGIGISVGAFVSMQIGTSVRRYGTMQNSLHTK